MLGLNTHLTRRLMLYITSCVLGALLITVATQLWVLQPLLEQTRNRNVDATIENLGSLVTKSLWVFNQDAAIDAANAILRDQFISGVIVNDHSNIFEYRGGDLAETDYINPELKDIIRIEDKDALLITVPLLVVSDGADREFNIGTLQIRSDNRLINQQLSELIIATLAVSGLVIAALNFLIYFFVASTVAKPLVSLTEYVQKYAANMDPNFHDTTNPLQYRQDEIGRLYRIFNQQRADLLERDHALNKYRDQLEQTVEERTAALRKTNTTLTSSLDQLKKAQSELVQNAKLVSLGTLVSGIAHEVNTPLGIAITASSHFKQELNTLYQAQEEETLTKSEFERFLLESKETETLLSNNLNRAATLIHSFKKVAVDQSSDDIRLINLKRYIDELVVSLGPRLKQSDIKIFNKISSEFEFLTAPGAVAQIATNLIMNSIIHGFDDGQVSGHITFDANQDGSQLKLSYSDSGRGMDSETLSRVYDPFYTTNRSEGGSGLGMNIVYNLVTSKLGGTIETTSELGNGIHITIAFTPMQESRE